LATSQHLLVVEIRVKLGVRQAQRAQAGAPKVLHVLLRDLLEFVVQGVIVRQPLIDDSVGALQQKAKVSPNRQQSWQYCWCMEQLCIARS
jgi:hypothetical protein